MLQLTYLTIPDGTKVWLLFKKIHIFNFKWACTAEEFVCVTVGDLCSHVQLLTLLFFFKVKIRIDLIMLGDRMSLAESENLQVSAYVGFFLQCKSSRG